MRIGLISQSILKIVFGLALCFDASAHAVLLKSEPARRAQLSKAPSEVRLWFNERLEPAYAEVSVLDAHGRAVTDARGSVAERDAKLLQLKLPELAAGKYTVKFRVLSVDGHTVQSQFFFTVKGTPLKQ
jgi:copper resistance protein C